MSANLPSWPLGASAYVTRADVALKLPTLSGSSANNCTGQGCSSGAGTGTGVGGRARTLPEEAMTKSRFGLIAGFAGAAFAAWWWQQQRGAASMAASPAHERGELIFSNAPVVDDAING